MEKPRAYTMSFASVYPLYVVKAEKKSRTKDEVDEIIFWLTGYDKDSLAKQIADEVDMETFFNQAPHMNPNASLIKGVICGHRVEEIEDPVMQKIRQLDKLVDELAKGKSMEQILRKAEAQKPDLNTVDEYIAKYEGEVRERMEKLRALIRECSPDISEKISWGMATFVLKGNLVHFAGQKQHLGFYPGSSGVEAFAQKLSEYKSSKGAVQFPYNKPMPYELIREIVMFRVKEQTAKK